MTTADDTGTTGRRARLWQKVGSYYHASADEDALRAYNTWVQMATVATLISATVTNLPPISIDSSTQIAGFLDYNKRWGLDYDVDVEVMNWENAWSGGSDIDFAMAEAEGASFDVASDAWTSSVLSADGTWRTIDPSAAYNSTWPNDRLSTPTEQGAEAALAYFQQFGYATTVVMEALGFDALDSMTLGLDTTDANEALHSNEVVKHIPSALADYDFMNDPTISSHKDTGGIYEISWQDIWETRAAMAKRYHALYDSSDPATTGTGEYSFSSVTGVRRNEEFELARNIDDACRLIGPELEVISLPKRLINHVQKRRKIPDNLVSAFGYVAEDMYDPTATAEEMGDTTADIITNYVVEGTEMSVLEEGVSGGTGRGSSEGSWDEITKTWIPHDEIY
tara:strand:- start:1270 stop:2454 length:1185 start_codon:yes stop_codon:yes gene_type:complete